MINKHKKILKIIFSKINFKKQTYPQIYLMAAFMFNVKCLLSPFVLYKLFSNFFWLFNIKRIYQWKYFSVKKNLVWFLEKNIF
jgi:hypothetical protein